MRRYFQVTFWVVAFVVLTFSFGRSYGGYAQSLFFVTFLFPVILGTSLLFNAFLVPRFLLKKKYFKFLLYSAYALVFSVYLEILALTLSLVILANYQYERLNPRTTDILWLTMVMYLLVFMNTILLLLQQYFTAQEQNRALETEQEKQRYGILTVISGRKHIQIPFESILFAESLGNYVRIHQAGGKSVMTRERISSLEGNLPGNFIRIHRSIVVNVDYITAFTHEAVNLEDLELPISRKYKQAAQDRLNSR
jgi:two-component system, LytTR family, response regulator LytT